MARLAYLKLLKNPKWQKKRLEILQSRKWECEACGATEECLHVHHNKYVYSRMPWDYEDSDFVVLCEHCHADVEMLKVADKIAYKERLALLEWYRDPEFIELKKLYQKGLL